MATKQIVFTIEEWQEFAQRLAELLHKKAQTEFRLIDRETGLELTDQLQDYCAGQVFWMVDEAMAGADDDD